MAQDSVWPWEKRAKPLVGQLGFPGVAPDITPIVGLFMKTPMPRLNPSEVRCVKMSVGELARSWCKYFGWSREEMAQVLKEVADEKAWDD
jgi:hypothetical protein